MESSKWKKWKICVKVCFVCTVTTSHPFHRSHMPPTQTPRRIPHNCRFSTSNDFFYFKLSVSFLSKLLKSQTCFSTVPSSHQAETLRFLYCRRNSDLTLSEFTNSSGTLKTRTQCLKKKKYTVHLTHKDHCD